MTALPRALILDPHDGGLALARGLRRQGVEVVVLSNASASWVARSRGVSGVELPTLAEDEARWLEELAAQTAGATAVALACSDRACALLAEHRGELPDALLTYESPDSGHMRLMDKASLYEIADAAGLRYPWRRVLDTEADLDGAATGVEYPCVLKPALSHEWRRLFGEERVFVIDSPEALDERARPALAAGLELLVSEHVPGPETSIEGHVTVRLADGSRAFDYTRRKIRQWPLDFGAGAVMEAFEAPATRELSDRLLDAGGFVGLASVEAKIDERTGEPVLIEANVRVPQSFGLGDACGADASWRTYAALAGLSLGPAPRFRTGVRIVVPALEARAARARLRRGEISRRELLRSYRGVREVGVLDPRDPGPGLALMGRLLRSRLRRKRPSST